MLVAALACFVGFQIPTPPAPKPAPFTFVDKPAGWGKAVGKGELVTIQFVVTGKGGREIANSKKRGLPYRFRIGMKDADPLLNLVTPGMKPRAVRTATVLATVAYGPKGVPGMIPPNEKLHVVIELLRRGG